MFGFSVEWLRTYLPFENGVPSHQTVGRVMSLLKGDCVAKAFVQFMASLFSCQENEIIALDGKTLRRSFDKATGQKPLHILNAWDISLSKLALDLDSQSKKFNSAAINSDHPMSSLF